MPIYEYVCGQCRHRFERLTFGSDAPTCPSCSAPEPARQPSTFAVSSGGSRPVRSAPAPGGCGSCGDPRGPGACQMN